MRASRALVIVAMLGASAGALAQSEQLRGLLSRAAASEAAGKMAQAEAAYLEALGVAETDEERAQVISRLGEVRRRRGDREGALSAYRQALDLHGPARAGWLSRCISQLASLAHQMGEVEVARSAYQRLLTDFSGSPGLAANAALGLARLEREAGDLTAAINRLEQILAASEDSRRSYQARHMLVEYLLEAEQFQRAADMARAGPKGSRERADLLVRTANALLDAGQFESAEKLCREVLAEQPDHRAAGRLLYEIACERGTVEKLEAELLAEAKGPDGTPALRRLAEIHAWEGEEARALGIYEQLLDDSPEDVELLYRVGSLAKDAGDLARAARYLARLLALQPDHRSAGQALGEVYVRQGQPEKALASFQAAVQYRPEDPASAQSLGRLLSRYSLYRQALAVYERTRREFGEETLLAYDMGRAFVGLMEYETATREFLTALTQPAGASARLVSYELERLAADEIAGQDVLRVLDSWAQREDLGNDELLAAARAYLAAGRPDRGLPVLQRLGPQAGLAILELAGEQEARGERDLAADLYELALKRGIAAEQRGAVALRLAEVRLHQGRWRDALKLLEDEPPSPMEQGEAALLRADILLRFVRDVASARDAYHAVLAVGPEGSPDAGRAAWGLADCLFAAGEWDRAEKEYGALAEVSEDVFVVAPPPPPGYPRGAPLELMGIFRQRDEGRMSPAHAALRIAEISLRRGDLQEAAARFKQVAQEHRASGYANDALERLAFIKSNFDGEGEAEAEYLSALALLERGRWDEAGVVLKGITAQPMEPLADDALLLLAESWAHRDDPERAVGVYRQLADEFSDSLLAPTALLKAAHLLCERLSRTVECRGCLRRVVERYPDSAAADEARDLLELIPATSA